MKFDISYHVDDYGVKLCCIFSNVQYNNIIYYLLTNISIIRYNNKYIIFLHILFDIKNIYFIVFNSLFYIKIYYTASII